MTDRRRSQPPSPGCLGYLVSDLLFWVLIYALGAAVILLWILWKNHPVPAAILSGLTIVVVVAAVTARRRRRGTRSGD